MCVHVLNKADAHRTENEKKAVVIYFYTDMVHFVFVKKG